jgi:GYF domain 2
MKKYYFFDGAAQLGPFTLEELQTKKITSETSVWFDPMPEWKPAGEIDELKSILNSAGTPPLHPVLAAKADDWNNKQFYYTDAAGAQQGPFKLSQLEGKNITSQTGVWYDPLPKWTTAGEVPALKNIINKTAAAPHPVAAEDWNNKQFYFTDAAGTQQGPFNLKQLEGKNITSQTAVWYDPLPKWTTAGQVPALKDIINKTAAAPHPVAAAEDWNSKQFYFTDAGGTQQGPFTLKQLEGRNITSQTAVWYDPLPKWTTAGQVPALKDIINKTSAAPHPVAAAEDWNNKQFYFTDAAGTQQGPFTLKQLEGKNITSQTAVWYDPLPKWTTAGQVPALKDIINRVASHPVSATEDWNNKQFYFTDAAGAQQGPFTLKQLEDKNITSHTAVWYDPLPKWTTAGEVAALKAIINKTAPAPHPVAAAADWNSKQFYFTDAAGAQQGPFNLNQLGEKNITSQTAVWYDPLPKWTTAGEVPALKDIIDKTAMAPHAATTSAAASKGEDWNNKFYFFTDGTGVQQGPFKLEQLKGKNIVSETPVWYDPLPEWTTAGEVDGLKDIINNKVSAS